MISVGESDPVLVSIFNFLCIFFVDHRLSYGFPLHCPLSICGYVFYSETLNINMTHELLYI